MKDTKANHDKNSRDWVEVARQFGEKGIAIQRDASLSWDQKLEKQKDGNASDWAGWHTCRDRHLTG